MGGGALRRREVQRPCPPPKPPAKPPPPNPWQTCPHVARARREASGERPLTTQLSRFHMPNAGGNFAAERASAAHGARLPTILSRCLDMKGPLVPRGFRFF